MVNKECDSQGKFDSQDVCVDYKDSFKYSCASQFNKTSKQCSDKINVKSWGYLEPKTYSFVNKSYFRVNLKAGYNLIDKSVEQIKLSKGWTLMIILKNKIEMNAFGELDIYSEELKCSNGFLNNCTLINRPSLSIRIQVARPQISSTFKFYNSPGIKTVTVSAQNTQLDSAPFATKIQTVQIFDPIINLAITTLTCYVNIECSLSYKVDKGKIYLKKLSLELTINKF